MKALKKEIEAEENYGNNIEKTGFFYFPHVISQSGNQKWM